MLKVSKRESGQWTDYSQQTQAKYTSVILIRDTLWCVERAQCRAFVMAQSAVIPTRHDFDTEAKSDSFRAGQRTVPLISGGTTNLLQRSIRSKRELRLLPYISSVGIREQLIVHLNGSKLLESSSWKSRKRRPSGLGTSLHSIWGNYPAPTDSRTVRQSTLVVNCRTVKSVKSTIAKLCGLVYNSLVPGRAGRRHQIAKTALS